MARLKIGVFGDSFTDRQMNPYFMPPGRQDESWLRVLEDEGHIVESFGRGGTSTWFSYENFLQHYKYYDAIIFSYSHHARIHTMPDGFQSFSYIDSTEKLAKIDRAKLLPEDKQNDLHDIIKGVRMADNFLFNTFVVSKIFEDVNHVCRRNDIKLVNLLPFEFKKTIDRFNFKASHGDVLYNLIPVVEKELVTGEVDCRFCHLTAENNKVLGNIILDSLRDRPIKFINLAKEGEWVFSPEIIERYKNLL